jgi:outer membrane protein assembly factor BamB
MHSPPLTRGLGLAGRELNLGAASNYLLVEIMMSMQRHIAGRTLQARRALLAIISLLATCTMADTISAGRLISRDDLRHLGLERAWFAQVRLDRARNQVERAVLANDRLIVLTTAGVVQELNAQTGETLWIASVGNSLYPNLGPAVGEQHVALVNGSTLYVLDRTDGRPVKVRRIGGAPGAAPALTTGHVLVPLLNGRVVGFPLDRDVVTPWYYQSFGRAGVPPTATASSVVWATDSGHVYISGAKNLNVRSRLETGSEIVAPAAQATVKIGDQNVNLVFVAAVSGEVFAAEEATGRKRWKNATGYTITRAPAAVGDSVYVTSDEPALHSIDAATGLSKWEAPNVAQFAAASRNRVYGVDELGGLVVLDAKTGAPVGRIPTNGSTSALVNDQTDRLYLVSNDGQVQCLREIGAKEPLYHRPAATESEAPAEPGAMETAAPGTAEDAETEGALPDDTEDPFGGAADAEGMEAEVEPADEAQPMDDAGDFGVDDGDPFGNDEE